MRNRDIIFVIKIRNDTRRTLRGLQGDLGFLAFESGHNCRATAVTPDIDAGPCHIEDTIKYEKRANGCSRQPHSFQNDPNRNE